jgi:hypothetical protein
MSDKNRKKRLSNLLQKAYVVESKQLYLRRSLFIKPPLDLRETISRPSSRKNFSKWKFSKYVPHSDSGSRLISQPITRLVFQELAFYAKDSGPNSAECSSVPLFLCRILPNRPQSYPRINQRRLETPWTHQTRYIKVYSGFNNLGNEGIQYLSRADWKFLGELWLRKSIMIQREIRLECRGSSFWAITTGNNSNFLVSVAFL